MYITVRLHVPVISRGMAYGGVAETRESRRKCAEVCALEVSGSVFVGLDEKLLGSLETCFWGLSHEL